MAKVFPIYGGQQHGAALGELPWLKCVEAFELDELCRTEDRPSFEGGDPNAPFPEQVVIRIEDPEAEQHGIKPGYFLSPMHGQDAQFVLDEAMGRFG